MNASVSAQALSMIAKGRRASHRVAQILIDRIQDGVYPPDSLLPPETQLLQEFPVSRTALREALTILQCIDLIDIRRGVGMKVLSGVTAGGALDGAAFDLLALLEACCVFELESIALAAGVSASAPEAPSPHIGDIEAFQKFHVNLAAATGNGAIVVSVRNLWNALLARPVLRTAFSNAMRPLAGQVSATQALVAKAVARGDVAAARHDARALFNLYLSGVIDAEEHERLRQAELERQRRRSVWQDRLRATASPADNAKPQLAGHPG